MIRLRFLLGESGGDFLPNEAKGILRKLIIEGGKVVKIKEKEGELVVLLKENHGER